MVVGIEVLCTFAGDVATVTEMLAWSHWYAKVVMVCYTCVGSERVVEVWWWPMLML